MILLAEWIYILGYVRFILKKMNDIMLMAHY